MRARTFHSPTLVMMVLASAGCYESRPPGDGQPSARAEPCSPSVQQAAIFYDEGGDPSEKNPALSATEIKKILEQVATQTSESVWLIRVKLPRVYDAYVIPDETTSRVRAGRAYSVRETEGPMHIGSAWRYIQVSLPGHSLTPELSKPSLREMPFEWTVANINTGENTTISKEDLVDIVDFVRQQSAPSHISAEYHNVQELPILAIIIEGNALDVMLGYMHDAQYGHGVRITIKRAPTGYKLLGWGTWVS